MSSVLRGSTTCGRSSRRSSIRRSAAAPPSASGAPRGAFNTGRRNLELYLHRAAEPTTVAEVARSLAFHRKTLVNRLALAGAAPRTLRKRVSTRPGPRACWRPRAERRTDRPRLALSLRSSLRNMLRRYTGLTPQEVRDRGARVGSRVLLTRCVMAGAPRHTTPAPSVASPEGGAAGGTLTSRGCRDRARAARATPGKPGRCMRTHDTRRAASSILHAAPVPPWRRRAAPVVCGAAGGSGCAPDPMRASGPGSPMTAVSVVGTVRSHSRTPAPRALRADPRHVVIAQRHP
jgi:hypothetical protein